MFVNFVEFSIKKEKEQEFKDWFKESNAVFSKFDGFVSRALLLSIEGKFAGLVMHKNRETFMKMEGSKERNELRAKVLPIFEAEPMPGFYEVVELQ